MANNINTDAVKAKCGIIRQIGMTPGLAGMFFTLGAKGAIKDYTKIKESIDSNPQAPDLFLNRQVRCFDIKSHMVLSQAVESDAAGNVKVVFNPGTDEEAKATVVAGAVGFGDATTDAIKKALSPNGDDVIFANGPKLLKETDALNDAEMAWIDSLIDRLNRAKQTILNVKNDNHVKIESYMKAMTDSTPKDVINVNGNSVEITVEDAD